MKRIVSGIILMMLLLIFMFSLSSDIKPVKSVWSGPVSILADGSIYPPNAPLTTIDKVTYILTDDIVTDAYGIYVGRSNIIIDGNGHTVQGTFDFDSKGIACFSKIVNVTIKNLNIKQFYSGIYLEGSSNNIISGNNITYNRAGIYLRPDIYVHESVNNTIYGNNIIASIWVGIACYSSSNKIYHNNFIGNANATDTCSSGNPYVCFSNSWDDDYPSGGNTRARYLYKTW
jgi:parallel beta-helix repeat protein